MRKYNARRVLALALFTKGKCPCSFILESFRMKNSLFFVSLRAFFFALFAALGLGIALIPITLIWSGVNAISETRPQSALQPVALPNAEGAVLSSARDVPLILQIDIKGVIGDRGLAVQDVENQLVASQEGPLSAGRVKGILLAINSPGGTASDSDAIYRLLLEYKERFKVPIFAHVDGLCASGAVYIGCAADKIYASASSCIGSVGVISRAFNYSKLADLVGLEGLTLFAGKGKDEFDPWRPWKEGEGENRQRLIRHSYDRFVDIVAKHRGIDRNALVDEWGAGIYPAADALVKNFIDQIADRRCQALEELARASKVDPKSCAVIQFQPRLWLRDLFAKPLTPQFATIEHDVRIAGLERFRVQDPMGLYYQLCP